MSVYQNARVYWEMYGGVEPEGNTQHVHAVDIQMDVGGWAADDHAYFQVSVYGRKTIDSPNIETIYRAPIHRPAGSIMWTPVRISQKLHDYDTWGQNSQIRCVVVKVELIEQTYIAPNGSEHPMHYSDQYQDADAPPWGIRIHSASIYGSSLDRDMRPSSILAHILAPTEFTYSGPDAGWSVDQLTFTDVPNDRQTSIDDVNGMLGWNYACWDGTEVEFSHPKSGTAHAIAADDPRTSWSVTESLDETYTAVRVCYGNKNGKPREVIVHGDQRALGFFRADTLQAPESIKSRKSATRFGRRYLDSHETKQVAGTVSIQGIMTAVPHVVTARRSVGVAPGAVLELNAPAAKDGTGPGINSPLTTQWFDTSGNGNHGTLNSFTGLNPWTGSGTPSDPYRVGVDGVAGNPNHWLDCGSATWAEIANLSLELWVFAESDAASYGQVSVAAVSDNILLLKASAGLSTFFSVKCADGYHYPAASLAVAGVHHIVLTAGATGVQVYCDGVAIGAPILSALSIGTAALFQLLAGYGNNGIGISAVRFYPFALTPEQVAQNYAAGVAYADTLAMTSDPLLIRPGDTVKMTGPARTLAGTHEVTRVTLRPLEWAADVEFGTNSKRFDTWLARLAAGAKSIKRR